MNDKVIYSPEDRSLRLCIKPVFDNFGNFEIERVWELLGDSGVIEVAEIYNGVGYNIALMDGDHVYFITGNNWEDLRLSGETVIDYQGQLEDFIDYSIPSHIEFLKWLNTY